MMRKSVSDFHTQVKQYMTELTERIKRATTKADYGFRRKPELRHQYGMLFNHHGQVISGLKNMDLFLSVDLLKVEDIAHVPPPFPECDNWATPHKIKPQSTCVLFFTGIWKGQPRTHDGTEHQHKRIPRRGYPHNGM